MFVAPQSQTKENPPAEKEGEEEITLQQLQKAHDEILKAKDAQLALLERRLEEAENRAPGSFETSEGEVFYHVLLGKVEEPSTLVEKRL